MQQVFGRIPRGRDACAIRRDHPLQFLAYDLAVRRGCDVDQPCNLANRQVSPQKVRGYFMFSWAELMYYRRVSHPIHDEDPCIHVEWNRLTSFVASVRIVFADVMCWYRFSGDRH